MISSYFMCIITTHIISNLEEIPSLNFIGGGGGGATAPNPPPVRQWLG